MGKFKVGDKVKMKHGGSVYTIEKIDGNKLYIGDGQYVTDYDVTLANSAVCNYSEYTKGKWIHDSRDGKNYIVQSNGLLLPKGSGCEIKDAMTGKTKKVADTELNHYYHMGEAESCQKCQRFVKNSDASKANNAKFKAGDIVYLGGMEKYKVVNPDNHGWIKATAMEGPHKGITSELAPAEVTSAPRKVFTRSVNSKFKVGDTVMTKFGLRDIPSGQIFEVKKVLPDGRIQVTDNLCFESNEVVLRNSSISTNSVVANAVAWAKNAAACNADIGPKMASELKVGDKVKDKRRTVWVVEKPYAEGRDIVLRSGSAVRGISPWDMYNEHWSKVWNSSIASNSVTISSRNYPICTGKVNGCDFTAKVFDDPSAYGIQKGRISKLTVQDKNGEYIINYDRGWDIRPTTAEAKLICSELVKTLGKLKLETRDKWHKVAYKGKTYFSDCQDTYGRGYWLSTKEGDNNYGIWANPSGVKAINKAPAQMLTKGELHERGVAVNGVADKVVSIYRREMNKAGDSVKVEQEENLPNGLKRITIKLFGKYHDDDKETPDYRIEKAIKAGERAMYAVVGRGTKITNDGSFETTIRVMTKSGN